MTAVIYASVGVASIGTPGSTSWRGAGRLPGARAGRHLGDERDRGLGRRRLLRRLLAGAIVIMLGIYFMALGQSFALALSVYLTCAVDPRRRGDGGRLRPHARPGLIHAATFQPRSCSWSRACSS